MWEKAAIKDIAVGVYDGPHATPPPAEEGPIYLGIDNVTPEGRLDLTSVRYIAAKDYEAWTKRVVPCGGDVVFSYEATLHRYAVIPEGFVGCLGRRMALVRPDATKVDGRYLHYAFLAPEWRALMESNTLHGSTVNRIPLGKFPDFKIALPALDTQRRIAAVLSAYDDLIENNTKRIRALEEMARAVYREWFLSGRCAEYAACHVPASAVANYINGYAFKPEDFERAGMPIIKIRELKAGVDLSTPRFSGTLDERFRIRAGDLLFSWSADLNVYIWSGDEGWLNQHLFVVRPHVDFPRAFLFHALASVMPTFRAMSNGATMKHIKRSALDTVKLEVATPEMRRRFADVAEPMIQSAINLQQRNRALREARDLLLPKLLSGELSVERVALP